MSDTIYTTRALPRSSYMPYPELVEHGPHTGPWTVADANEQDWLPTNGAADMKGKRIFVPYESGAMGVVRHELAHCRFSPERLPRVKFPIIILQAVEDARINLALARLGLPVTVDRAQRAHIAHLASRDAKEGRVAAVLVRAIASIGTQAAEQMREEVEALPFRQAELAGDWLALVERRLLRAARRVDGIIAPFPVGRRIASELAADLKRQGLLRKELEVPGVGCCHVFSDEEGEELGIGGDGRLMRYRRRLKARKRRGAGVDVGRMTIAKPPLVVRQPRVLRSGVSPSHCGTEGTSIRRPDRLAIDRAIFGRMGRGGGGTVLVDVSGSMSFTAEQVEEVVRAAGGAAVVAIYSGSGHEGELRIVARADRRASSESFEPYGSGNVVDLPALEWLARQPMPRIWVSDGCVTGAADEGCEKLLERCNEVAKRGSIQRVDNAEEAVAALS